MPNLGPVHAPGRRIDDADQHVDFFGLHDRGRRDVPQIFADQHADAAEAGRMKGLESLARRKISLLLEQPIGRQVHLAMHVHQTSGLGVERGVVELMAGAFLDEPGHQAHRAGGLDQLGYLQAPAAHGHFGHHVAQEIAGQRQFGKDDQIGIFALRGRDLLEVLGHVALPIAQHRRDLGQGHAQIRPLGTFQGLRRRDGLLGRILSEDATNRSTEREREAGAQTGPQLI